MNSVVYLATLQLAWGGLFDAKSADGLGHLVTATVRGTPGPTLCGIDRFAKDSPGFSVGGGVTPHGVMFDPCPGCVEVAKSSYQGLPVAGMASLGKPLAEAIGVHWYDHGSDAIRASGNGIYAVEPSPAPKVDDSGIDAAYGMRAKAAASVSAPAEEKA